MVIDHRVIIDLRNMVEGENTVPCAEKGCTVGITLLWDGKGFSLTERDANDPTFGKVVIEYIAEHIS